MRLRVHQIATGRREGELVFADEEGAPLNPARGHHAFKRACRAAGFPEDALPHLHELRHAFATHALAAGLSAHVVARLLGHSSAALVWARYGHALPSELASAGEALSAWRASLATSGRR